MPQIVITETPKDHEPPKTEIMQPHVPPQSLQLSKTEPITPPPPPKKKKKQKKQTNKQQEPQITDFTNFLLKKELWFTVKTDYRKFSDRAENYRVWKVSLRVLLPNWRSLPLRSLIY